MLPQPWRCPCGLHFLPQSGQPYAYSDDGEHIYTFGGKPVGYLADGSIFNFDGRHLGYFHHGALFDQAGQTLLFTHEASGGPMKPIKQMLPMKGVKQMRPMKGMKQMKPMKPMFGLGWSQIYLEQVFGV